MTLLTLVLLRLARCAAAKPIWRSYLPEVHPPKSFPSRSVHPFGVRTQQRPALIPSEGK